MVDEWKQRVCESLTRSIQSDFLLAFVDGLPNSLLQHLEESLEGKLNLEVVRKQLHQRREQLCVEQRRVSRVLLTFQRVAHAYAPSQARQAAR